MKRDDYLLYVCAIVVMVVSATASFFTKNRLLFNMTLVMLVLWLLVGLFISITFKIVILLVIALGLIITSTLISKMKYDLTTGRKKRSKPSWPNLFNLKS